MDIKELVQSKLVKGIIIGAASAAVLVLTFYAGEHVGYRRASFAYHGGENYYKAFEGRMPQGPFGAGHLPNANGAVGRIVSIALPNIVVADKDGSEKTIHTNDKTIVRSFQNTVSTNDLKVGDLIVTIGTPTADAAVSANLIRIVPAPQQ